MKKKTRSVPTHKEEITVQELQEAIGKTKLSKAPGHNKITNETIKALGELRDMIVRQGKAPEITKNVKITEKLPY